MKTRRINIFDDTPRAIKCIEKKFDYLGNGELFTEERLEIGALYTLKRIEMQSYGMMVYLKEVDSKFGFQDFLFEELSEHDSDEYMNNYKKWLRDILKKGEEDIQAGRVKNAEASMQAIKEKYGVS